MIADVEYINVAGPRVRITYYTDGEVKHELLSARDTVERIKAVIGFTGDSRTTDIMEAMLMSAVECRQEEVAMGMLSPRTGRPYPLFNEKSVETLLMEIHAKAADAKERDKAIAAAAIAPGGEAERTEYGTRSTDSEDAEEATDRDEEGLDPPDTDLDPAADADEGNDKET